MEEVSLSPRRFSQGNVSDATKRRAEWRDALVIVFILALGLGGMIAAAQFSMQMPDDKLTAFDMGASENLLSTPILVDTLPERDMGSVEFPTIDTDLLLTPEGTMVIVDPIYFEPTATSTPRPGEILPTPIPVSPTPEPPTNTPSPTNTPEPTATFTPKPTATPTASPTTYPTATATATSTDSPTPTSTATPTPTSLPTLTPTPIPPTFTPSPTSPPPPTSTPRPTSTPLPTVTPTGAPIRP